MLQIKVLINLSRKPGGIDFFLICQCGVREEVVVVAVVIFARLVEEFAGRVYNRGSFRVDGALSAVELVLGAADDEDGDRDGVDAVDRGEVLLVAVFERDEGLGEGCE